jgi:hypothetical protein
MDQPIVSVPKIGEIGGQKSALAQVGAGIVNTAARAAEGLESGTNIALAPILAMPGVGRVAGAAFGVQQFADVSDAIKEARAPGRTIQQRTESVGRGLTDILFGILGARFAGKGVGEAAKPGAAAKPEVAAPETETPTTDAVTKEVTNDAVQPSDAQIQTGQAPLGEQARPAGEVPRTSGGDNVERKTSGAEAGRPLPPEREAPTQQPVAPPPAQVQEVPASEIGRLRDLLGDQVQGQAGGIHVVIRNKEGTQVRAIFVDKDLPTNEKASIVEHEQRHARLDQDSSAQRNAQAIVDAVNEDPARDPYLHEFIQAVRKAGYPEDEIAKELVAEGILSFEHLSSDLRDIQAGKGNAGRRHLENVGRKRAQEEMAHPERFIGNVFEQTIPQWARDEMGRRGLSPGRTFNDVDLGNPSVQEAIRLDPTLTNEQKSSLLRIGSLPVPAVPQAKGQEPKPEPAPAVTQFENVPTVELPIDQIKLSKDVPNFKEGASAETGVVPQEQLAGKYTRLGTGAITVWERANGDKEIISGRHRLDLAKRSGEKTIPTQVVREADGFTRAQAITFDAEANIRDGQGSVSDYANYFRNSDITPEEASGRGLLARDKGRKGFAIGRNASDDLYALYRGGKINETRAAAIAEAAPGQPELQGVGIRAANEGASPAEIAGRIEAASNAARSEAPAKQGDFFADTSQDEIWKKQGQYVSQQRRALQDVITTRRAIVNRYEAATATGSIKAERSRAETELADAQAQLQRWQNWATDPDLRTQVETLGAETKAPAAAEPPTPPEPAAAEPQLRAGEAGTGDLFQGGDQPFNLAGETGVDYGAQQKAAEAAAAERAKTAADHPTLNFGEPENQPEAVENGVAPEKTVTIGSTEPRANEISPQALGVTHPMPGFIKEIADYFVNFTPSQIANSLRSSIKAALGETFAKTTIADRESGELGARWVSARIAAPHLADSFVTQVLEGTNVDKIKFGAALTEDNLRSVRAAAETPEAAQAVTSIIGAKNSPFKTEAEYQAFLNDPGTAKAIERHRALWSEVIDPMFRKAQLLDPDVELASRGESSGARINLFNDAEGRGGSIVSGTATGNLTATFRRKSPFAIRAKGTGQNYNINYSDIMANTFGRQLEIAAKNAFEQRLVDTGNAVIAKVGEKPTLPDGEDTVGFPLKRKSSAIFTNAEGQPQTVPINQNIYVRKSMAGEYRRGADVDLIKVPGAVKAFTNAANRAALAGLTDASVHVLNLNTALLTRPSVTGSLVVDSLLSATGRADVPVMLAKVLIKATKDNRAQMAELAEIGALRGDRPTANPLGNVIKWYDKTTRLMLDDAYQSMRKSGLVEDSETARREFINQVGQYNKRAQGDLRRLARDTGLGPFVTAGTTFNTLGLRTLILDPGVKAASPMAAAAMRANVLSKWVGAAVFIGTANYLLTHNKGGGVMGRPGVPIGRLDSGLNDENGRPLSVPVFDILGLGRALRVTGARGFIESQRKGLTLANSFDAAARDAFNTNISPFTGPPLRFLSVGATGYQPAVSVGRESRVVPPGQSQWQENMKQAVLDANPLLRSLQLSRTSGEGVRSAVRQQIPRLSLQPSQSAEFMSKYPEIVRKAQARDYVNDVIGRARKLNPQDKAAFVKDALSKLAPEDRDNAIRTMKYSRILDKNDPAFRESGTPKGRTGRSLLRRNRTGR